MVSLSSGGLCDGILNKQPFDNGCYTSSGVFLNCKKRKVSAFRDFPRGCGRNAPHINLMSHYTETLASLGDKENLVADEMTVDVVGGDFSKGYEIGNELLSREVVKSPVKLEIPDTLDDLVAAVAGKVNGVELSTIMEPVESDWIKALEINGAELSKELHAVEFPAGMKIEGALKSKPVFGTGSTADEMVGTEAWSLPYWPISDANTSEGISLKNKYLRRKVSATRDFPPFCGRNAPCLTEKAHLKIGLGDKTLGVLDKASFLGGLLTGILRVEEEDSPVREAARIVGELDRDIHDGNSQKRSFQIADLQGRPLIKTSKAVVAGSPVRETKGAGVEEVDGDVCHGNAQKSMLEGMVPEPETKSQIAMRKDCNDVNGVIGEVGKEFVGYFHDKRHGYMPLGDSNKVDSAIRQGLMAAPNCPSRQGKRVVNTSLGIVVTGSEVRQHDANCIIGLKKSQSVSRAKAYEADYFGEKSRKKKLLSSGKASCEGKGLQAVKDDGDFDTHQQVEVSSAGQNAGDFEVTQSPFGPNCSSHGNARNKVKETLRLFQAICRKLSQGEETKLRRQGYMNRRIDLLAAQIVKAEGKEVNTGKYIVGSVPGVEVADEFHYRVELYLVGIHRLYQAGIDYMKHDGMIIATSVVASGSYEDDMDNPDVLIYSGHGGNIIDRDKQPEDQKLERGNLALKNSVSAKNPVRVIRGSKKTKASDSGARAKIVVTYAYDGLYTVERYWREVGPHGKLVFKFELRRIPGQRELAWKEVKKSNKSIRLGVCVKDISEGKELFPICAVNTVDNEKPPTFNYITRLKYPNWYSTTPPKGCNCIGGCSDSQKCSCIFKNGGEIPYNHNGAIVEAKPLIFECGPSCKCPPSCYNRVSQHGIKIQFEIFKTVSRGWGVRSLTSIPSGSFICEYTGELLEEKEAEQTHNDEYLFDIGRNYSDCSHVDGLFTLKPDAQSRSSEVLEDGAFTIDASQCGNVGRFINHSCSPNLYAQNVLYGHEDKRMPHIMLFAAENIPPLQELTYHYNYSVDQIHDSNGNVKMKSCYCGSTVCTGRMY